MTPESFSLGIHAASWLWTPGTGEFPVCVSHTRLARCKTLRPALRPYVLDSGGFTVLQRLGEWPFTPADWVRSVRRYVAELGTPQWVAPMDWMCERPIIEGGWWGKGRARQHFAGTHLSVAEHQRRTVTNYLQLRMLDDSLPWRLALQGDTRDDYLRCWDLYDRAGVDVAAAPIVLLGSVCRRQSTREAEWIIRSLMPLRLHGLGIKTLGLQRYGYRVAGADSASWSVTARWESIRLPGCSHGRDGTGNCANCPRWAAVWRERMLVKVAAAQRWIQDDLLDGPRQVPA